MSDYRRATTPPPPPPPPVVLPPDVTPSWPEWPLWVGVAVVCILAVMMVAHVVIQRMSYPPTDGEPIIYRIDGGRIDEARLSGGVRCYINRNNGSMSCVMVGE